MPADRWTIEKNADGFPVRLAYNRREPAPVGAPWCDDLLIRATPDAPPRQQARVTPAGFDAIAEALEAAENRRAARRAAITRHGNELPERLEAAVRFWDNEAWTADDPPDYDALLADAAQTIRDLTRALCA
jgi:hypothetical protein